MNQSNEVSTGLLRILAEAVKEGHLLAITSEGEALLHAVRRHVEVCDSSIARINPVKLQGAAPALLAPAVVRDETEARTMLRTDDRRTPKAIVEAEAPTVCGGFDEVEILPPTLDAAGPDTIVDSAPEDTARMVKP